MTETVERTSTHTHRAPAGAGYRSAMPSDLPFVRDLFAESRDDLLLLPADTRDVIIDMRLRDCRRSSGAGLARHDIITCQGVAVGHALIASDPVMITVVDLAVCRAHRGRGFGSYLLADIIVDADHAGQLVQVRVHKDSPSALRFFGRHRFHALGGAANAADFVRLVRTPGRRP